MKPSPITPDGNVCPKTRMRCTGTHCGPGICQMENIGSALADKIESVGLTSVLTTMNAAEFKTACATIVGALRNQHHSETNAGMDKHGNLTGWRAAVAKACGNRDPIDPAGVDQVVAAYVRFHVEGSAASGRVDKNSELLSYVLNATYIPVERKEQLRLALSASGAEVRAKLQEICDRWNWRGPARESNLDITIREARALLARTDRGSSNG